MQKHKNVHLVCFFICTVSSFVTVAFREVKTQECWLSYSKRNHPKISGVSLWSKYQEINQIDYVAGTCPARAGLPNGSLNYNLDPVNGRYQRYTAVYFSCNSGYHRTGPSYGECGSNGGWSGWNVECEQSNETQSDNLLFPSHVTKATTFLVKSKKTCTNTWSLNGSQSKCKRSNEIRAYNLYRFCA